MQFGRTYEEFEVGAVHGDTIYGQTTVLGARWTSRVPSSRSISVRPAC